MPIFSFYAGEAMVSTGDRLRQRGATLVEFALVAISLLLFGTLIVEAAHWQMLRQMAYVALLDSARVGATHPDRAEAMQRGFVAAFLPPLVAGKHAAQNRQAEIWAAIQNKTGMPAWRIEILQPQDVQILHTRLTYLHEPLSPMTRALLRAFGQEQGDCMRKAWAHGMLPIRLTLDIETHARASPKATPTANVVYGDWDCTKAAT
ncbi:TadE/TadG family type IV pilus assembly protein [Bordetella sp. 02P26C-1]|uniref:TadE/TadG family type IV pilus assembly protein n=1 Tax=Bordetella sp. 02P26C-1 TaxID=2683195 RepID=UPI001352D690|nr:TadE family protein [Bordetella sp. 02P26C-1]MVW77845.1 pilus assembly protein [Bordetella sp. 02P26C-1]